MAYNSIEAQIFSAIVAHLETIPWIKTVNWKKVRIAASEFRSDECPGVQVFADSQSYTLDRNDVIVRWRFFVELVLLSEVTGEIDQLELLEKADLLFKHIGSNFKLNSQGAIPGFIQLTPVGGINELRMVEPFYIAVLELEAQYRKWYTSKC